MRRVAITGAGTVNPLAQTVAGTYQALTQGRSAIGPLEIRDVGRLTVKIGAQVRDWQPEAHFNRAELGLMDPFCQYAVAAARQAVRQSGLMFDGNTIE
ncbi:MAG: beta-ketoacyl synthase N-terminal-like domain-containing protein, partial [Alphaproteobacteria bacterium]